MTTASAEKIRYRGKTFYLHNKKIYDSDMNLILEDVGNGFLDLYEYFEYFEPNEIDAPPCDIYYTYKHH